MSELRDALAEYLAVRRSLGFKLQSDEYVLRSFVAFADQEGASFITTQLTLAWMRAPHFKAQPATWAQRLGMARVFARWRKATDPRTEVPPEDLLPVRFQRKPPHIYSDEELDRLLRAARELPSPRGLRGLTCATIFGLLSVTGLRVSEVAALDRKDVDLQEGVLTIRRTKFGKSRLVPLHVTTCEALAGYAKERDRILRRLAAPAFFLTERGARFGPCGIRYSFAQVSRLVGLRPRLEGPRHYRGEPHGRGPRLHDLRHRFAARTLIDWYRAGVDVEREIPKLATYLGHVHVNETYWYLEAVPELLELATRRVVERGKDRQP